MRCVRISNPKIRRAIHAGRQPDQMAPRAYHVVFRNLYPKKFVPGYRAEIPEFALPLQFLL